MIITSFSMMSIVSSNIVFTLVSQTKSSRSPRTTAAIFCLSPWQFICVEGPGRGQWGDKKNKKTRKKNWPLVEEFFFPFFSGQKGHRFRCLRLRKSPRISERTIPFAYFFLVFFTKNRTGQKRHCFTKKKVLGQSGTLKKTKNKKKRVRGSEPRRDSCIS